VAHPARGAKASVRTLPNEFGVWHWKSVGNGL